MKIYTIGFTQKTAETIFRVLRQSNRTVGGYSPASGWSTGRIRQKDDLAYFLRELANGCQYIHLPELAPTSEILDEYRK